MSNGPNIGDLPSWILVLLIGFGVVWAASNGIVSGGYESLGRLMIAGAILLGIFYFAVDIANKVG